MKKLFLLFGLLGGVLGNAIAEPTTQYGSILTVRPYLDGTVYVTTDAGYAYANVYTINTNTAAGRTIFAALMAAFIAKKQVAIEMAPISCPCYYAPIQSIYVR